MGHPRASRGQQPAEGKREEQGIPHSSNSSSQGTISTAGRHTSSNTRASLAAETAGR